MPVFYQQLIEDPMLLLELLALALLGFVIIKDNIAPRLSASMTNDAEQRSLIMLLARGAFNVGALISSYKQSLQSQKVACRTPYVGMHHSYVGMHHSL